MATKKRSTRATRTPAETEHEFEEVQEAVASRRSVSANERAVIAAREAELREAAGSLNLEKVLQALTATGLNLTKTVSGISEELQTAAKRVEELTEAGKLLEKDIEELHGKEVAASAIEDLVANFKSEREALEKQLDDLKKNIDQERADALAAWNREQQEHTRAVQERNQQLQQERARENEQYNYLKTEDRKRAEAAWQNQMADQKRNNDLKQAELERNWAAKTAELAAKEAEFAALKTRVDGIPAEIEAAVKKAEAILGNSMKRDYTHQMEIAAKDYAAKETVLTARVETLTTQVAAANTVIANLNAQLATAQSKVAEIAANALNAASGRQALAEVQGIVTAQQNSTKKQ